MRLPLLVTAGVLAVMHVIGVLFARPLFRPAEVLALLCLLLCCRTWGLRAAVAVLVAGAALTVPPPTADGAGLQFLSPEQYEQLAREPRWQRLVPVLATLFFVLVLLAVAARRRVRPGRPVLAAAIAAAVLIIGYVVLRSVIVASAAATAPLLLALAAIALAAVAVTLRQRRAAVGAVLLVAVAVVWIDAAIGAVELAYAVRDDAMLFSLDLIEPTDTLPQPTPALVAGLQLTAAMLLVAGLTRRVRG